MVHRKRQDREIIESIHLIVVYLGPSSLRYLLCSCDFFDPFNARLASNPPIIDSIKCRLL